MSLLGSDIIYLIGLAKRREKRSSTLEKATIIAIIATIVALSTDFLSATNIIPQQDKYTLPLIQIGSLLSPPLAAASLIVKINKNHWSNLGSRAALLATETFTLLEECYFSHQLGLRDRGLAPWGSPKWPDTRKSRAQIRSNCWKLTLLLADLSGRPHSDFPQESISSFPRLVLWAEEKLDRESLRVTREAFVNLIHLIDDRSTSFQVVDFATWNSITPREMKRPSFRYRLKRFFSLHNMDMIFTIIAGAIALLTYFKLSP